MVEVETIPVTDINMDFNTQLSPEVTNYIICFKFHQCKAYLISNTSLLPSSRLSFTILISKQLLQLSPDDHMLGIDNVGLDFAELDLIIR